MSTNKISNDPKFSALVAERIALARGDMSKAELGRMVGRSDDTITNYEEGNTSPDVDTLNKIAKATGKKLGYLLGLHEEKPPTQDGSEAYLEWLKSQAGAGSVDPSEMPSVEAAKMLAGYFRFGDREIETHIVFNAKGPPGEFGGHVPPD